MAECNTHTHLYTVGKAACACSRQLAHVTGCSCTLSAALGGVAKGKGARGVGVGGDVGVGGRGAGGRRKAYGLPAMPAVPELLGVMGAELMAPSASHWGQWAIALRRLLTTFRPKVNQLSTTSSTSLLYL